MNDVMTNESQLEQTGTLWAHVENANSHIQRDVNGPSWIGKGEI